MSDIYIPLKRSERLQELMRERYVKDADEYMIKIRKLMGNSFAKANIKMRIHMLVKIIKMITSGFNNILVYSSVKNVPKLFRNVYFRSFVWMKEAEEEPETKQLLFNQIEKYRKKYKSFRHSKLGVIQELFGLSDDLMDIIDEYI